MIVLVDGAVVENNPRSPRPKPFLNAHIAFVAFIRTNVSYCSA